MGSPIHSHSEEPSHIRMKNRVLTLSNVKLFKKKRFLKSKGEKGIKETLKISEAKIITLGFGLFQR